MARKDGCSIGRRRKFVNETAVARTAVRRTGWPGAASAQHVIDQELHGGRHERGQREGPAEAQARSRRPVEEGGRRNILVRYVAGRALRADAAMASPRGTT